MLGQIITAGYDVALHRLAEEVAEAKRADSMASVTIIVPNQLAGVVCQRFLAQGFAEHTGIAGLRITTLTRLAEQFASTTLAPRRPQTRSVLAAGWRAALDGDDGLFTPIAQHPATIRALARAHRELRSLDQHELDLVGHHSSLSADVVRLYQQVVAALSEHWYDEADLLRTACWNVAAEGSSSRRELGAVIVYLPQSLTGTDAEFANALAAQTPCTVIAGLTGQEDADRAVHRTLERLGLPLATYPAQRIPLATQVMHASDADDEVRCVVRRVISALQDTPAHRIAVFYGSDVPYARLLHEYLASAGLTVNGPGIRPVRDRAVARGFLDILGLAQSDVPRASLFTALGQAPLQTEDGANIPTSRWERLSRAAGIVSGDDWSQRLETFIQDQQKIIDREGLREDPAPWRTEKATSSIHDAQELMRFAVGLAARLTEGSSLTTWPQLATWASDLFRDLYGTSDEPSHLPREEQYALVAISQTLASLANLETVQASANLTTLREVLDLELEAARPRVGRFGDGILVAPISAAVGLDLDVAFVIGLTEDTFPGRQAADPLLPQTLRSALGDALPDQRDSTDAMQRHLAAAFSSAPQVTASFPRGDLRRSTPRLPSRWLMPTLRALTATPTLAATAWNSATSDTITGSHSFWDELRRTDNLSGEHEWRVRTASAGIQLDDAAITTAQALQRARASDAFTRFDGNLSGAIGLPDHAHSDQTVSPTALEQFAACPHTFFVNRLLGVQPLEQPEEIVTISPADVGTLIHACMDRLVQAFADDLPSYGEPWTTEQREKLREIAIETAAEFENRGVTGHRLLWERERAMIMTDLDAMLDADDQERFKRDARVLGSELRFGSNGIAPVVIEVPGGAVHLTGSADKVDQTRDGILLVTDIKAGSKRTYAEIATDPVVRGTKLQLPVYAHAARARYGGVKAEAMYWFVRKDRGTRIPIILSDDLEALYAQTLATLVNAIADGLFPPKSPGEPDFGWTQCQFCNPDGLGHADSRLRYESKRHDPVLAPLIALIDPDAGQA